MTVYCDCVDFKKFPFCRVLIIECNAQKKKFKRGISLKRFRYLHATFHFRAEIGRLRTRRKNCEPGEGVVKICRVKKHVREREGSSSARWTTSLVPVQRYDHVAKKKKKNRAGLFGSRLMLTQD